MNYELYQGGHFSIETYNRKVRKALSTQSFANFAFYKHNIYHSWRALRLNKTANLKQKNKKTNPTSFARYRVHSLKLNSK